MVSSFSIHKCITMFFYLTIFTININGFVHKEGEIMKYKELILLLVALTKGGQTTIARTLCKKECRGGNVKTL